jgi:Ca2+-binding RTX toxin-like protein
VTDSTFRRAVISSALVALIVALPAAALTIRGTNGPDVIRGTAKADLLLGRGGNDRLLGLAGNDVLNGGPGRDYADGGLGNDRLLLRDTDRDTAVCGPGRDTVVADRSDAVRATCETVLRPAPPVPPAPPPPPPPPPGTRGNPIPLGQAAPVGNGWSVKVTGVVPDATAQVLAANQFNDPPAAGGSSARVRRADISRGVSDVGRARSYGRRSRPRLRTVS